MDEADHAKRYERKDRQVNLDIALNKPDHNSGEAQQHDEHDRVICIDCKDLIDLLRLKAKPDAVRCIFCKTNWEKRQA